MKKCILIIILANILTFAKSQIDYSVKFGVNISHLSSETLENSNINLENNSINGCQIGLTTSFYLNKNLIFKPELLFSQKGGELKSKGWNSSTNFDYLKTKKTYLDLPLLMRLKLSTNNKLDLFINSGVIIGYSIWTNQTLQIFDLEFISNGPEANNAFNFGVVVGAGLILSEKTDIEFRYEYGLTDVLGFQNESYLNKLVSITLSYRLVRK